MTTQGYSTIADKQRAKQLIERYVFEFDKVPKI